MATPSSSKGFWHYWRGGSLRVCENRSTSCIQIHSLSYSCWLCGCNAATIFLSNSRKQLGFFSYLQFFSGEGFVSGCSFLCNRSGSTRRYRALFHHLREKDRPCSCGFALGRGKCGRFQSLQFCLLLLLVRENLLLRFGFGLRLCGSLLLYCLLEHSFLSLWFCFRGGGLRLRFCSLSCCSVGPSDRKGELEESGCQVDIVGFIDALQMP